MNNDHLLGSIPALGQTLLDVQQPLESRFRCIFELKNIGGVAAVDALAKALFADKSALLKHEVAYCLGQMCDNAAIPHLNRVLEDTTENPMVRHEAAEALGAIGNPDSLALLQKFLNDSKTEVSETCQIAIDRIKFFQSKSKCAEDVAMSKHQSIHFSVDPAPPCTFASRSAQDLRKQFLDSALPLFERYRALFALREKGDTESVQAITDGLFDSSALFRHEVAYVLGQMQHSAAVPRLTTVLEDSAENAMVRHEAAEALGAIATEDTMPLLRKFKDDTADVVRESCTVALDIYSYNTSDEFHHFKDVED